METPDWALSISYWAHMLATTIWLGGLTAVVLFFIPGLKRTLDDNTSLDIITRINCRLDSIGWFSIILLTSSGLVQMSANSNYEGFINFSNFWSGAILAKHILFVFMIGVNVYITWGLSPALQRAILRHIARDNIMEINALQGRIHNFLKLNLFFGAIILGLTALARTFS